jgi:threonine/homoserine/homoserine lactone efflux protein
MLAVTATLILFLFPLAYSPGPGNLFFASLGARFGFIATLPANAGYHLATLVVTFAIGLGFSTVIGRVPAVFDILRYLGAAYVLWLAWKLIRAGILQGKPAPRPASFLDGAVLLLLNPKAYVIIALMFTQFLDTKSSLGAVLLIATVFTMNNLIAFSLWALAGDRIARLYQGADSVRRLNLIFGTVLAAVAIWMALP